jgi:membrane dipeptidase
MTESETSPSRESAPFFCDAHIDTLSKMLEFGRNSLDEIPADWHVTAARLRKSNVSVAVFATFTEKYDRRFPPHLRTLRMIDMAHSIARDNSDLIEPATDMKSILRARKAGRIAMVLSIENGIAIEGDLGLLRNYHRLGVRLMSLTWNHRNELGDGAWKFRARRGLTALGLETLREMERLGMIVDASHLNERTFRQVIEAAEKPVVATHSNASGAYAHARNLTDAQIRAISETGGFIGLNFCASFLNEKGNASIRDVVRHARHIAEVGGARALAIGSDFDGIETTPAGLEHIGKMGKLIGAFRRAGFSRREIEAIAHGNFLRVFREVCG